VIEPSSNADLSMDGEEFDEFVAKVLDQAAPLAMVVWGYMWEALPPNHEFGPILHAHGRATFEPATLQSLSRHGARLSPVGSETGKYRRRHRAASRS
jgi:hypothetical protein